MNASRCLRFGWVWMSLLAGCAAAQPDGGSSEVAVEQGVSSPVAMSTVLPELPELANAAATKVALTGDRFEELKNPQDRYYLRVDFGTLGADRFQSLKTFFGGHSQVPFAADRRYELTDFLHPAMQAVVNQTFTVSQYEGKKLASAGEPPPTSADDGTWDVLVENGIRVMTNCYGTTAEIERMLHPERKGNTAYSLYWPSRLDADNWFSNGDYSVEVKEGEIRFGDVMVIRQRLSPDGSSLIMHTAIVVSKNIVFEKTDSGDADPYRLALRQDDMEKYERLFGDDLVVEYRRFNGPGMKPLPEKALPTNEMDAPMQKLVKRAFPQIMPENITFAFDVGIGGGNAPETNEILPSRVEIHKPTGRGILIAPRTTLHHFVALPR